MSSENGRHQWFVVICITMTIGCDRSSDRKGGTQGVAQVVQLALDTILLKGHLAALWGEEPDRELDSIAIARVSNWAEANNDLRWRSLSEYAKGQLEATRDTGQGVIGWDHLMGGLRMMRQVGDSSSLADMLEWTALSMDRFNDHPEKENADEAYLTEAIAVARLIGYRSRLASSLYYEGLVQGFQLGDWTRAQVAWKEAAMHAEATGQWPLVGQLAIRLSQSAPHLNDYYGVAYWDERMIRAQERTGDTVRWAQALGISSRSLAKIHFTKRAEEHRDQAVRFLSAMDMTDPHVLDAGMDLFHIELRIDQVLHAIAQGDSSGAVERMSQLDSLVVFQPYGTRFRRSGSRTFTIPENYPDVLLTMDRGDEALALVDTMIAHRGYDDWSFPWDVRRAVLLDSLRKNDEALRQYQRALDAIPEDVRSDFADSRISLLVAQGLVFLRSGYPSSAYEKCASAATLVIMGGDVDLRADACRCRYLAERALGKDKAALVSYLELSGLRDSLAAMEKKAEIADLFLRQDMGKEAAIDSLNHLNEVARLESDKAILGERAERQRILRNIGFAVAGVVLLLLGGIWRQRNRIAQEKKRSDGLLLNILPAEVAEELKANGSSTAREFDQATILFTDFKGFTGITELLTPAELVEELNTCFKAFDGIITARGIEKIKTIGDAYMAAGGLPDPKSCTATDVVLAALEMQEFMATYRAGKLGQGRPAFEMRVGIHTGPVVAGIVGVKKFAYDIWGDTVNIASRMESSGEVGQVNISGTTYTAVKNAPGLVFRSRGHVQAKGKGDLEMWFVSKTTQGQIDLTA